MAQQRIANLIDSKRLGDDTKLLSFRMVDSELGFIGGQYLIVDTEVPIPGNKTAKRAYSIISADEQQREFRLAVRRIGEGPGSNYMHRLKPGAELRFSGPWGKFVGNDTADRGTLVLATDTGITAALGLLHGRAMLPAREQLKLIWFAQSDRYFLPFDFVIGALDLIGVRNLEIAEAPPVGNPDRIRITLTRVDRMLAEATPGKAFLCGDGLVVHAICDRLTAVGLSDESIRLECFFNNPQRRVAA